MITREHKHICPEVAREQVVIVFQHADELSVDESDVDDVGENANFHDMVSSLSIKNTSSNNDLCVKLYIDAFQSVLGDKVFVPADYGDLHVDQVEDNDQYDSIDLTRQDAESCAA